VHICAHAMRICVFTLCVLHMVARMYVCMCVCVCLYSCTCKHVCVSRDHLSNLCMLRTTILPYKRTDVSFLGIPTRIHICISCRICPWQHPYKQHRSCLCVWATLLRCQRDLPRHVYVVTRVLLAGAQCCRLWCCCACGYSGHVYRAFLS
jgi:hypothetical protein